MAAMATTKTKRRKTPASPKRGYKTRPWKQRELVLLGILSDAKVAERIGRAEADVRAERIRRGIRSAERRITSKPPAVSSRDRRLWDVYRASLGGPVAMVPVTLGWLAAQGWEPTAMEMLARAGVARATAYRHLALLRDWRRWLAEESAKP